MLLLLIVGLALGLAACSPPTTPTDAPVPPAHVGEPTEATLVLGGEVYATDCQACHGDREGRGATGGAPPHNERGHTWHHPDAQLVEWVLDGKPPGAMPAFRDRLTEQEVQAVLAFIKTWWTPEQRRMQADVSQRYEEALR